MALVSLPVVLGLAALPAIGTVIGSLLAERFSLSGRGLSYALHVAAGGLTAVVAVELMPRALSFMDPWIVIVSFIGGGAFMILVDWLTDFVGELMQAPQRVTAPWVLFTGVAVDLVTDGIMIGAGARVDVSIAILLGVGLLVADIGESFATFATLRSKGIRRALRIGLGFGLAALIVVSAGVGYILLLPRPEIYSMIILAFTAGVLMTVVVEEMAPQAHAGHVGRSMTAAYLAGFAGFSFIAAMLQ